ncbi:hypothetical protein HII31_09079 [Pseudocercospora fuligena]|uniref:Uncharacterized protein n=1 Tax=Pseudocercospora fuligena TaxID=685502 RepID=A0A8H6VK27_9PEZI|nr:hypothetical protein HII31_09079 [Pseudocercospora fuligena]
MVIVIFGIFAILLNNAAYSDDFSTILRLARGAQLSTSMHPADADGKDPLPAYLKSAKVIFAAKGGSSIELRKSSSNDSLISTLSWRKGKPENVDDTCRSGTKPFRAQDVRALALKTGFSEIAASGNDYENISLRSANDTLSPTSAMARARRSSDS